MKPVRLALAVQNCMAGQFDKNLESTLDFVSKAASDKADIIVFPEMNLTGYTAGKTVKKIARPLDQDLIQTFSDQSRQTGMTILTGMAEQVLSDKAPDRICVTHLVFQPDQPVAYYRKLHTAPNEKPFFSPGNSIKVFSLPQFKFGIQLCYDAHFPELSTAMALKQADALFFPHASPRGNSREKFLSWMRHLSARAFDNGLFVAAVNQTGDNGAGLSFPGLALVLNPDGTPVSRSLDDREHLHITDLDPRALKHVRSHRMRYFLPNRRDDLFGF